MDDNNNSSELTGAQGASDTITIDTSELNDLWGSSTIMGSYSSPAYGNVTISTASGFNGTSGSFLYSNGTTSPSWTTGSSGAGLHVTSDAEFEGDVRIKGVSIAKTLEAINDRLAILQPDPAKLEKFAALKKAYDHYKTLERLIGED